MFSIVKQIGKERIEVFSNRNIRVLVMLPKILQDNLFFLERDMVLGVIAEI